MVKKTRIRWGALAFTIGLSLTLLPSCKVGPNYNRPNLDVPATYKSATTQSTTTTAPSTQPLAHLTPDWWRLFNDPQLNRLEESAIQNNQDLRAAVARVLQARAAARITRADLFPSLSAKPSFTRSRSSGNLSSGGSSSGRTRSTWSLPVDVSYEVDVWGRIRRAYEASNASLQASADDVQVLLQTLESDVAQNYFNIRSLDAQDQIILQNIDAYQHQVDLLQTERRAGLITPLEVLQAQALLDSTRSSEIDARRQRALFEHALAILLGRPPAELSIPVAPLDLQPPLIPAGLPSRLLERRPDVAAAEQNLIAANANIGVATANFYPVFTLPASAGFESLDLKHLLDWQSRVWDFAPNVSIPLFEGGRLRAGLEQAKQIYNENLATYRQQLLIAFQDVEDSLANVDFYAQEARAQEIAIHSSAEYLRLSEEQRKSGLISYLTVIDAERTLLNNRLTAAQVLNHRLVATVQLIKSLGGGWDANTPASTQPAIPNLPPAATRP